MMIGMRGGRITYLCGQNKGRRTKAFGRIRTYNLQPTAWVSNSGEEKDKLDHPATGSYTQSKGKQSTVQANI